MPSPDPELVLDFYSGPRGWSEGLRHLGLADVGIEWDHTANLTAIAAGHIAVQADCTTWPVAHLVGLVRLVIGSPPCTAFSMAGKGDGREHIDELVTAMRSGDWHAPIREREPVTVWAPLDMGRIIEECWPESIALEQVPPCLPLWEALAIWLRAQGYSTWVSVVNAADYGVPQTRRRAVLLASRARPMTGPEATHARDPQPTLFGPELEPWVSMATALGWGMTARPSLTLLGGHSPHGGRGPLDAGRNTMKHSRDNDDIVPYERSIDEPAPTVTEMTGSAWSIGPEGHRQPPHSWKGVVLDRRQTGGDGTKVPDLDPYEHPAPTVTGAANAAWRERRHDQSESGEVDPDWPLGRPATTLAGRDLVTDPGANANRFNGAEKSRNDGYRITIREALILQSFRPDHPVQGSRTSQFQQVGNAVPPRLAAHLCASVLGLAPPTFGPQAGDDPGDEPTEGDLYWAARRWED